MSKCFHLNFNAEILIMLTLLSKFVFVPVTQNISPIFRDDFQPSSLMIAMQQSMQRVTTMTMMGSMVKTGKSVGSSATKACTYHAARSNAGMAELSKKSFAENSEKKMK